MAKYTIVGVQHSAGTSKKTGKPYDMDILHVIDNAAPTTPDMTGNRVDTIPISRASGILTRTPNPGETIEVYFGRSGYVESVRYEK